jgi:hypothetical protein
MFFTKLNFYNYYYNINYYNNLTRKMIHSRPADLPQQNKLVTAMVTNLLLRRSQSDFCSAAGLEDAVCVTQGPYSLVGTGHDSAFTSSNYLIPW